MEIFVDYEGASIDILEKKLIDNIIIVSPKREDNLFSNYYNFKVENNCDCMGKIYIRNLNRLLYTSNSVPFIKSRDDLFKRMDSTRVTFTSDGMEILIFPYEMIEISSYPRYVEGDLNNFLNDIKSDFVSVEDKILHKVVIGNINKRVVVIIGRQHPGETLSSYFIEGIISEIINNYDNYKDVCYVFFPFVNVSGVRNGNHRFTDNIDFNRSWNSDVHLKEIDYIKEELKKFDIECFVDVHCDEVSNIDYIRTKKDYISGFDDVKVIADLSKFKRFLKALIKQRKIISLSNMTAREYVSKYCGCNNILVELSLVKNDCESSVKKGKEFAKTLQRSVK